MCFISHLYEDISTPGGKWTLPPTVGCWEHCVVNLKTTLLNYCLVWLHMSLHSYFLVQLSGSQCELSGNLWFVADNDLFKKLCPKMCFCLTSSCSAQYFTKKFEKMNTPQNSNNNNTTLSSRGLTTVTVWDLIGTPNSVIQPLQKIQNFAARLVLLTPPRLLNTSHGKTALVSHFRMSY